MTLSSFKSPDNMLTTSPELRLVTLGDITKAEEVAICEVPLRMAVYLLPEVKPAKEILEYSPDFGKSIVNESKNLGFEDKPPSSMPTKSLVDLSEVLPSKAAFKDRVGPKLVATVGEESSGVGEEEAESSSLAGEVVDPPAGGGVTFTIGFVTGPLALLLVVWFCEVRNAPTGIDSNINM